VVVGSAGLAAGAEGSAEAPIVEAKAPAVEVLTAAGVASSSQGVLAGPHADDDGSAVGAATNPPMATGLDLAANRPDVSAPVLTHSDAYGEGGSKDAFTSLDSMGAEYVDHVLDSALPSDPNFLAHDALVVDASEPHVTGTTPLSEGNLPAHALPVGGASNSATAVGVDIPDDVAAAAPWAPPEEVSAVASGLAQHALHGASQSEGRMSDAAALETSSLVEAACRPERGDDEASSFRPATVSDVSEHAAEEKESDEVVVGSAGLAAGAEGSAEAPIVEAKAPAVEVLTAAGVASSSQGVLAGPHADDDGSAVGAATNPPMATGLDLAANRPDVSAPVLTHSDAYGEGGSKDAFTSLDSMGAEYVDHVLDSALPSDPNFLAHDALVVDASEPHVTGTTPLSEGNLPAHALPVGGASNSATAVGVDIPDDVAAAAPWAPPEEVSAVASGLAQHALHGASQSEGRMSDAAALETSSLVKAACRPERGDDEASSDEWLDSVDGSLGTSADCALAVPSLIPIESLTALGPEVIPGFAHELDSSTALGADAATAFVDALAVIPTPAQSRVGDGAKPAITIADAKDVDASTEAWAASPTLAQFEDTSQMSCIMHSTQADNDVHSTSYVHTGGLAPLMSHESDLATVDAVEEGAGDDMLVEAACVGPENNLASTLCVSQFSLPLASASGFADVNAHCEYSCANEGTPRNSHAGAKYAGVDTPVPIVASPYPVQSDLFAQMSVHSNTVHGVLYGEAMTGTNCLGLMHMNPCPAQELLALDRPGALAMVEGSKTGAASSDCASQSSTTLTPRLSLFAASGWVEHLRDSDACATPRLSQFMPITELVDGRAAKASSSSPLTPRLSRFIPNTSVDPVGEAT